METGRKIGIWRKMEIRIEIGRKSRIVREIEMKMYEEGD